MIVSNDTIIFVFGRVNAAHPPKRFCSSLAITHNPYTTIAVRMIGFFKMGYQYLRGASARFAHLKRYIGSNSAIKLKIMPAKVRALMKAFGTRMAIPNAGTNAPTTATQ